MPKTRKRKGKGIVSKVKNAIKKVKSIPSEIKRRTNLFLEGPRKGETKRFKEFLDKNGGKEIKSISVGRSPVESGVKKVVNALTFGGLDRARKRMGYDDIYHNYMIIETNDGKKYRIEKNHVVEAKETHETGKYHVPLKGKKVSLNELIKHGEGHDKEKFYQYNPVEQNCQNFVDDIVKRNHLLENVDETTKKVIEPQNSKDMLRGPLGGVAKVVTDLAASGDRFIHGDGLHVAFNKELKKLKKRK